MAEGKRSEGPTEYGAKCLRASDGKYTVELFSDPPRELTVPHSMLWQCAAARGPQIPWARLTSRAPAARRWAVAPSLHPKRLAGESVRMQVGHRCVVAIWESRDGELDGVQVLPRMTGKISSRPSAMAGQVCLNPLGGWKLGPPMHPAVHLQKERPRGTKHYEPSPPAHHCQSAHKYIPPSTTVGWGAEVSLWAWQRLARVSPGPATPPFFVGMRARPLVGGMRASGAADMVLYRELQGFDGCIGEARSPCPLRGNAARARTGRVAARAYTRVAVRAYARVPACPPRPLRTWPRPPAGGARCHWPSVRSFATCLNLLSPSSLPRRPPRLARATHHPLFRRRPITAPLSPLPPLPPRGHRPVVPASFLSWFDCTGSRPAPALSCRLSRTQNIAPSPALVSSSRRGAPRPHPPAARCRATASRRPAGG